MEISKIEYNELVKGSGKTLIKNQIIKSYLPMPTYSDYRKGYIVRYFTQRINDENSIIYEISENDYLKFLSDTFYTTVNIDWRLAGGLQIIKDSNAKSVKLGSKKMKALMFYLPNYLQFSGY